jgi:hypothetical protein
MQSVFFNNTSLSVDFDIALDKLIKDIRTKTAKHFLDFNENLATAQAQAIKMAKKKDASK